MPSPQRNSTEWGEGGGPGEVGGWQGERKGGARGGQKKGGVQNGASQSKQEGGRLEGRAC